MTNYVCMYALPFHISYEIALRKALESTLPTSTLSERLLVPLLPSFKTQWTENNAIHPNYEKK